MSVRRRPTSLAEARTTGVKNKPDAFVEVLFCDPISLPIAYQIARHTNIHPLTISGVAFIARIGAAIAFASGQLSLGSGLAFIGFILDGVDGKVARMTDRSLSLHGAFDFLLDAVSFSSMSLALIYWSWANGNAKVMFAVAGWLALAYLFMAVSSTAYRLVSASGIKQTTRRGAGDSVAALVSGKTDLMSRLLNNGYHTYIKLWTAAARFRVLPMPTGVDAEVLLFMIAPLFGVPLWMVVVAGIFMVPDAVLVLGSVFALARSEPGRTPIAVSTQPVEAHV